MPIKSGLYDKAGKELKKITLPKGIFDVDWNPSLVSLAYRVQVNNGKDLAGSSKNRSDVRASTRKLYRQKGTGNARAGARTAGQRVGGGAIHGPQSRNPVLKINKKAGRKALMSALSKKLSDGEVKFVEIPKWKNASVKNAISLLDKNGLEGKTLVLHNEKQDTASCSFRNVKNVRFYGGERVNIGDLLRYKNVLISSEALKKIEEIWK
tara:strand:- start:3492 stop:4118 length:627 start_codon:yes stop_codon:yes gene_type:complete